jgi:lysophospholipase L1-like esterase
MKRLLQSLVALCLLATLALPLFSTAKAHAESKPRYVALGDSVAAGLGLPSTGPSDPLCGKSTSAYAYQVAQTKGYDLQHIACSGATVGDLFTKQDVNGTKINAQIKSAFANGKPQAISITAGANDVRWADYFKKCFADTCGTQTDNYTTAMLRAVMSSKLALALADISYKSGNTKPNVVVTGYYNPLSAQCALADPTHFTAAEMDWAKSQVDQLNQSLKFMTERFSFAHFAPVDFTGHDICSVDSWVQRPGDPASFHPTVAGQKAMAEAVLSKM